MLGQCLCAAISIFHIKYNIVCVLNCNFQFSVVEVFFFYKSYMQIFLIIWGLVLTHISCFTYIILYSQDSHHSTHHPKTFGQLCTEIMMGLFFFNIIKKNRRETCAITIFKLKLHGKELGFNLLPVCLYLYSFENYTKFHIS